MGHVNLNLGWLQIAFFFPPYFWLFLQVIYDKMTGRSRGFGFVTMSSAEEVEAAAQQFNGYVSL